MQPFPAFHTESFRRENARRQSVTGLFGHPLVFLALHVPLAFVVSASSALSTLHAAIAFLVGLWVTVMGRHVERVAYAAAYIIGAEVLWRMTGATVPWEFGKYATAALFILWLARHDRLQGPLLPFLYFVLLLPSSVFTLLNEDLGYARERISFNLSGPFTLMVCALFFSHVRLDAVQLQKLRLALIGPIISIATIAIFATLTNPDLVFTGESNNGTSGGYGPNQVSAALGLGSLLILFFVLEARASRFIRGALFAILIGMAAQSAMTFSRGGLYNAVGAALTGFVCLVRDVRVFGKILALSVILACLAVFVIIPKLDKFTDGAIIERFENTDPTNRDHIIEADLQIWREHPLFGVGPGQGHIYRRAIMYGADAHTEFSRLFAEHGFLGLLALVLLLVAGAREFLETRGPNAKAVKASGIMWSILYMLNAAMRLAAPSFLFGFAFANLTLDDEAEADK
jgi:O-antigen ligase